MAYLENCAEVLGSLDPGVLESCALDTVVGRSASATVYSLGSFVTARGAVDVALKRAPSPDIRAFGELRDTMILEHRVPELVEGLPSFIGTLIVEGHDGPVALLTEDASRANRLPVRSVPIAQETLALLGERFADVGGLAVFEQDTLANHACFDVDSQQRMLDLAPSIFALGVFRRLGKKEYEAATEQAFEAMNTLQVRIGAGTVLATRLARD